MKKQLLLFSLLFGGLLFSSSPNYTLSPGANINDVAPYNQLSIYDIYQNNISTAKIKLKWQLISQSIPSGWDFSVCDYATCYPGIPSSGAMDSVDVGSMGFLGLNIDPYAIPGTGVVKIFVYENGYFSQGDTLTWTINAVAAGIAEQNSFLRVSLFPNPVQEQLNVSFTAFNKSGNYLFRIVNQSGLTVAEGRVEKELSNVMTDNLLSGIYYYVLYSENKRVSVVKFIKSN